MPPGGETSSSDDDDNQMRSATKVKSGTAWSTSSPSKVKPDKNNTASAVTAIVDIPVGAVGIKWRIKVMRIYDSEEQWNGIVEIYFHWNKSANNMPMPSERPVRRGSIAAALTTPSAGESTGRIASGSRSDMQLIPEPEAHPVFVILNDEESSLTEEIYYKLAKYPTMQFGYIEYNVKVHERFELERFPFDRQFFKLEIECSNGEIAPWYCRGISSLIADKLGAEEAQNHNFFGVSETPSWQLDVLKVKKGERPSCANIAVGMSRLSGFYLSNIAIPSYLIGTGAVFTIAIDRSDYGSRLQCMIALFLTLVALKFVANFLPVISYSTLLDNYTLLSYMFLAMFMLENFFVTPLFYDHTQDDYIRWVEICAAGAYLAAWSLVHGIIIFGSNNGTFRKDWKDVEEDDQATDPSVHKECANFE